MLAFKPKPFPCVEIYEKEQFQKIVDQLSHFGFNFDSYITLGKSLFNIVDEEEEVTATYSLKEVIEFLRLNGRKDIEIQRYKGLGEMNVDQLWETTMDPAKRTLVWVTLPDAIAVDHMFSMLMGDKVAPRIEFIEQHALSFKNLDI